jgi:hypothetical protein
VGEEFLPENEFSEERNGRTYVWRMYDRDPNDLTKETKGLPIVQVEDTKTGFVLSSPLADRKTRVAAFRAWLMARHSRAAGTILQIMRQMGLRGVDPDEKLDETFRTYGHGSVADMATLPVDFANVPMHVPLQIFGIQDVNGGQEKSTRYQPQFGTSTLHNIKRYFTAEQQAAILDLVPMYEEMGIKALESFGRARNEIRVAFTKYYDPDATPEHKAALESRVLDTARGLLLLGQSTGFGSITSAREWIKTISALKGSVNPVYADLGYQIEALLSPGSTVESALAFKAEAPALIKHTNADRTSRDNLRELQTYLSSTTFKSLTGRTEKKPSVHVREAKYSVGEKMAAQYIATFYPAVDPFTILDWVAGAPLTVKEDISRIIYANHDRFRKLPHQATTGGLTVLMEGSIGEARDWNRHRAWGRFIQGIPPVNHPGIHYNEAREMLDAGYVLPLYVTEIPEFKPLKDLLESFLAEHYERAHAFLEKLETRLRESEDFGVMINVLPLSHAVTHWMHANPAQADYALEQRVRPGGLINYREQAWRANRIIGASDPYLIGTLLPMSEKPDPTNREQFFDRS